MKDALQKILIIYPVDYEAGQNQGIYEKMKGQGNAMTKFTYKVDYAFLEGGRCILDKDNERIVYAKAVISGWAKYKYLFGSLDEVKLTEYSIIYIRHLLFTTSVFDFLHKVSSINNVKIVYEFPTWPYANEWTGGWRELLLSVDKRNRQRCLEKIDLVVHYGGFPGPQESILISNGIEVPENLHFGTRNHSTKIKLIAVGKWANWNGLDRAINGLTRTSANIHLDIIGEGRASKNLRNLVLKTSLESKVSFHGDCHGDVLQGFLLNADIGIGTIGLHRKKVALDSSLKHRLYCSHGLPFVLSSEDRDFNEHLPFTFYVDQSDEPLDYGLIISKYEDLRKRNDYRNEIHEYALGKLSWKGKIRAILNSLS